MKRHRELPGNRVKRDWRNDSRVGPLCDGLGMQALKNQELAMDEHIPNSPDKPEPQDQQRDSFGPCSGVSFPATHVITRLAILCSDSGLQRMAMGQFYMRYHDAIYSYFRKLRFDKEKAQELLSRVNIKLADGTLLGSFNPKKRFRSYLKVVLLNVARDFLRQEKQRNMLSNGLADPHFEQAEKEFDRMWIREVVADAVETARELSRPKGGSAVPTGMDLLILMKVEGKSSLELADKYGISEHAVRGRARAARLKLVEEIRKYFREDGSTEGQIDGEIKGFLQWLGE